MADYCDMLLNVSCWSSTKLCLSHGNLIFPSLSSKEKSGLNMLAGGDRKKCIKKILNKSVHTGEQEKGIRDTSGVKFLVPLPGLWNTTQAVSVQMV